MFSAALPNHTTEEHLLPLQVGLAFVFAYGSYVVADAAKCSGIVAVVTNGMLMSMYVKPNLSEEAAHKIEVRHCTTFTRRLPSVRQHTWCTAMAYLCHCVWPCTLRRGVSAAAALLMAQGQGHPAERPVDCT